jgi:hypothetical protein
MVLKFTFDIKYWKIHQFGVILFLLLPSKIYKICVRKSSVYNTSKITDKVLLSFVNVSTVQHQNSREFCLLYLQCLCGSETRYNRITQPDVISRPLV